MNIISKCRGRDKIGHMLNSMNLTGVGVEVGTNRGIFAEQLLRTWRGTILHCIDPYIKNYDSQDPVSQQVERDSDLFEFASRMANFIGLGRCQLHRNTSRMVLDSELFKDNSLDFVYVDACHQYYSTLEDLTGWFKKVRVGGVIAGHDWVCPYDDTGGWARTVQPAISEFLRSAYSTEDGELARNLIPVYVITEPGDSPWSYYLIKKEEYITEISIPDNWSQNLATYTAKLKSK